MANMIHYFLLKTKLIGLCLPKFNWKFQWSRLITDFFEVCEKNIKVSKFLAFFRENT